jgi:hypothetical protein
MCAGESGARQDIKSNLKKVPPKRKKPKEKTKTVAEEKTNGAKRQNIPPSGWQQNYEIEAI